MDQETVIRLLELAATLGTGTVFGGLILWWFLRVAARKLDEHTIVMLTVVQSISTLRTQHMMHEATVHGVNTSTGETQDERTRTLWAKIHAIEQESHDTNKMISEAIESIKRDRK